MDRTRQKNKDRVISAASFPDEDPYQMSSGNDPYSQTNDIDLWSNTGQNSIQEDHKSNQLVNTDKIPLPKNGEKTNTFSYDITLFDKLEDTHQVNSGESPSSSQRVSESTSSSHSLDIQDSAGFGSTRM